MKDSSIEVFVNEEYGYRLWKWIPNMTEQEFIGWFNDLTDTDIIKFYFDIRRLPGKIVPWPSKRLYEGNATTRMYGDPLTFRPYYYMHMNDVLDTFISIGDDVMKRRPTMKYDWKEHWLDHRLRMEAESNMRE